MIATERLLKHFDRLSEAPDAIARLRRFILDLAVRGKLVEQNPHDEPASELLSRISAERARLRSADGIKRGNAESGEPNVEPVFPVPTSWTWTTLGEVCSKTGSGSTPRGGKQVYQSVGVPFLRSQNVYNDGLRLDDVAHIDERTHRSMEGTHVAPGDLLLNITGGSIGRCCMVPGSLAAANVSQHVAIIRVAMDGLRAFIHRLILSPYFQSFVIGEQTGAGRGGLPKNRMDRIPVALPPLAEQHRIVARVDELIALCDQLEAAQSERESHRDRLVSASLARLNHLANPPFSLRHARFHLDHLPRMTTSRSHIRQLRQTILELAVQGRLVPQRPTVDLGAATLLARLKVDAHSYCLEHGLAPPKAVPLPDEVPFRAPVGWEWTRLCDLFRVITDGDHLPPPKSDEGVAFLTIGNVTTGELDFTGCRFVPQSYFERIAPYRRPSRGDLLYTVVGATYGRPVLVDTDRDFCVQRHIAILKPGREANVRFIAVLLRSPMIYGQAERSLTGTAQPTVALRPLRNFLVCVPPADEQQRIVAKVDELMSVCDQFEAHLAAGRAAQMALLESTLRGRLDRQGRDADAGRAVTGSTQPGHFPAAGSRGTGDRS